MWLRATSSTKASSTRLALRCISRPVRNTARIVLKMVASYSSSGLNDPRKRLPISATSSSPKRQLSEKAAAERDREVRVEGNINLLAARIERVHRSEVGC